MRRIAIIILLLACCGCQVARATVTYHSEDASVSFTIEPELERKNKCTLSQPEA